MRALGPSLSAIAAVATAPLVHLIPGASQLTGLTFEQAAVPSTLVIAVIIAAAAAHRRWGSVAWQYRAIDHIETLAVQLTLGLFIVWSDKALSPFWLFYVVHALIVGLRPGPATLDRLSVVSTPLWVATALAVRTGSATGPVMAAFALGLAVLLIALPGGAQRRASRLSFERQQLEQRLAALVVDGERGRIARELHDGLTADLTAIAWRAAVLAKSPPVDDIASEFAAIAQRARAAIDDTKAMVWALRDDLVVWDVILSHVRGRCVDLCEGRVALTCELPGDLERTVPGQLAVDIVRIVQESVRNAVQHGSAHRVRVRVAIEQRLVIVIVIEVEDDGVGLPEVPAADGSANLRGGLGNLERRAQQHGGEFVVERRDPGTLVRVTLPAPTAPR